MIKTVVKAHYVHISNIDEMIEKHIPAEEKDSLISFLSQAKDEYDFTIVKYDSGNLTLIYSSDWDTANEPLVDVCYRWKKGEWFAEDGTISKPKVMKNGRQIYHNKWQFVSADYQGFDVEKAKERTKLWNSIPNLNKSKIGNKTYWVELLKKNGIAV